MRVYLFGINFQKKFFPFIYDMDYLNLRSSTF